MKINVGGNSLTIDVDGSNDSLEGMHDTINNAAGNDNLVTSSVINVSDNLILTSNKSTTDNAQCY